MIREISRRTKWIEQIQSDIDLVCITDGYIKSIVYASNYFPEEYIVKNVQHFCHHLYNQLCRRFTTCSISLVNLRMERCIVEKEELYVKHLTRKKLRSGLEILKCLMIVVHGTRIGRSSNSIISWMGRIVEKIYGKGHLEYDSQNGNIAFWEVKDDKIIIK